MHEEGGGKRKGGVVLGAYTTEQDIAIRNKRYEYGCTPLAQLFVDQERRGSKLKIKSGVGA